MEGATLGAKRDMDVAMFAAWHTAVFALNGYAGKLKGKSLSDFLGKDEAKTPDSSKLERAKGIAFFHRMKARGLPVTITKNEIN